MAASFTRLAMPAGTTMVDGLLVETLRLAAQARAYLADAGGETCDGSAHAGLCALVEACELNRLSARLGFSMAWLLTRHAVRMGELTADEAREPRWRLEGSEICLAAGPELPGEVSPRLAEMLDRSLALYRRVACLNRRLDG
jgi:regulator of CtrA degradation